MGYPLGESSCQVAHTDHKTSVLPMHAEINHFKTASEHTFGNAPTFPNSLFFFFDDHPIQTLYDCSIILCANPQFFHSFLRMSFHFSVGTIVEAATSVTDQKEEDDIDLISDSPWADAKLSEVMLSSFSLAS